MLDHYIYFHTHGNYEGLVSLESVDTDAGTAGQYPTARQWYNIKEQVHIQQDRWVFEVEGKGFVMQGERQSPRGLEYVQVLLIENGEMTVRELTQRIRYATTEAVLSRLNMLIDMNEVSATQLDKKTVYRSEVKIPSVDAVDTHTN